MNTLKRTLALVATLAMTATAFASCGDKEDDKKDDNKTEATTAASQDETEAPAEETTVEPESDGTLDPSVKTGGKTFTVAAWNADDVPALIAQWKGLDYDTIADDLANEKVDGINAIIFGVGGGQASERYDQLFNDGGDLDVYFCEADWALKYINDDTKTAALEDLGFSEDNFSDVYSYTTEIGRATEGANKGKMVGASWQAAAKSWWMAA